MVFSCFNIFVLFFFFVWNLPMRGRVTITRDRSASSAGVREFILSVLSMVRLTAPSAAAALERRCVVSAQAAAERGIRQCNLANSIKSIIPWRIFDCRNIDESLTETSVSIRNTGGGAGGKR